MRYVPFAFPGALVFASALVLLLGVGLVVAAIVTVGFAGTAS